jgi:hypothetical protein
LAGLLLAVLVVSALSAFAQIDRGAIVGKVLDATGAVMPKATVTVTNKATGVALTTPVNEAGEYQILALIPGTYSVKVTAQGFETSVRDGVDVHVQDRLAVNFTLKVGAVTEQVTVTGQESLLQTQSADVGAVVETQKVNDLPLNGRRYADLALLEPGVNKFYAANNPAPDRFSVNGNMELQNNFLLNGIDNNSWSENLQEFSVQVVQPPPDAIEEFRVQTRTYSTEFGNSAGAVINATIKSGTNAYHGNLFEYIRNAALNANLWVNGTSQPAIPKGGMTQNQFGGTFGGPIIKNKTFFFGDFERFTKRQSTTVFSTVPTKLMKAGDFTELLSLPVPIVIGDSPVPGQSGCYVGNKLQATSSTGQTCLDPVAAKLMTLLPDPDIPGTIGGYAFQGPVPNDVYSFDGKIDHNLNQSNRLFGSYSYRHLNRQDPPWTGNGVIGSGNFATQYRIHTQLLALGWTRTLSTSVLNDLRFGFNRDYAHSDPVGVTLGKSQAQSLIGLTGIPDGPGSAGLPPIEISGLQRIGTSPWRPQYQISQAWNIAENLSRLSGSHSFKFGYQYLKRSDNFLDLRAPQGELQSNGRYTGTGLADFLLGNVDTVFFTTPLVVHYFQPGHSFYAMDTWKTTSKLTLTYGLRYELFAPILERKNNVTNFTPANGGGIVTATKSASGWYDRALIHPDRNDFAPRVGFAYQMMKRAVLRGGYGVFYQHNNRIGSESLLQLNPPFLLDVQLSRSGASTVFQLKDGFPLSTITGSGFDLTQIFLRAQDANQRSSYVEQASLGVEAQVMTDTVASANYVGNWGRKMNRLRNFNQPHITGLDTTCPVLQYPYANFSTITNIDTFVGLDPNPPHNPICQSTGQHAFVEYASNDGNSSFNGLELSLQRRMSKGLGYSLAYTWSHALADYGDNLTGGTFPQNAYDYAAEKSNSNLDIRHRFVGNFSWDLPFGQGKRFLSSPGAASRWLGDWQLHGIVTLQTGSPYTVTATNDGLLSAATIYPDCIGNPFAGATTDHNLYTTTGFLINRAAFAQPARGTYGSCRPRMFHGPGIKMADLSLFKDFRFTERWRLQFRAEFFNAFNHPNFGAPSNDINSPTFGQVSNTLAPILGADSGGPGDPRQIQFALKLYF